MTLGELNKRITFFTSLSTDIYTNEDRVIAINSARDKLHALILRSQDEWRFDDKRHANLPIATSDLVADVNSYALPSSIYRINRLDIDYGSGYVKAHPSSSKSKEGSQSSPVYKIIGSTLIINPTPKSSGELCVFYDREASRINIQDLEDGQGETGFDAILDDYIALQASIDAGLKFDLTNERKLQAALKEKEEEIKLYNSSKNQDRKPRLTNHIESYD